MTEKSIVLIDDDFYIRFVLKSLLSRPGIKVYTSDNGVEGLAYIFLSKPDVIVIDTTLPKYGGLEVLKYISSNTKLNAAKIPVIVLHEGVEPPPDLPEHYFVLSKQTIGFLDRLTSKLQMLLSEQWNTTIYHDNIGRLSYWVSARKLSIGRLLLAAANRVNVLERKISQGRRRARIMTYTKWLFLQTKAVIYGLIFRFLAGNFQDENLPQQRADLADFRSRIYSKFAVAIGLTAGAFALLVYIPAQAPSPILTSGQLDNANTVSVRLGPIGEISQTDCKAFVGWACEPKNIQPLFVYFIAQNDSDSQDRIVTYTQANQQADTKVYSQCGDINHKFEHSLPTGIKNGKKYTVSAYAISTTGKAVNLVGSGESITCK